MNSKTAKTRKGVLRRSPRFIAPGQLTKDHRYGQKALKVVHETKRLHAEEQAPCISNRRRIAHSLVVHFGEDKWEEKDFTEESSFLDVLNIANRFIDVYSVGGVKIVDGDGKPIRNDQDLMTLLREQDVVENIELYVEVDESAQPLFFKLPQDNPTYVSVPTQDGQGADLGSDITEQNVEEISVPTQDGQGADPRSDPTEQNVEENPESKKTRKVRGKNKNKKIAGLQAGKKLEIQFYNNRGVGINHKCWSRHLGKIVRDKNICPIRVKTWKDMTETNKQDMWDWVTEYFSNPDIELYREHTLEHMDDLWSSWRSSLNVKYVKPYKTKSEVLKNVPPGMDDEDWEWLVNNKFLTHEFQKASAQNSNNRVNGVMPHRTGSKPHRHILYEMGCNVDDPHDIAKIFYETRQKNGKIVEEKAQEKYDEILKTVHANASLSPLAVVETCFGPQSHSRVIAFSGGMKRKRLNDSQAARIKKLKDKLHEKKEARQKNGKLVKEKAQETYDETLKTVRANASLSPPAVVETCVGPQGHGRFFGFSGRIKRKHLIDYQAARIKELEDKLHKKEDENDILKRRMDGFEERLARIESNNRQVSHAPPTLSNDHELALIME